MGGQGVEAFLACTKEMAAFLADHVDALTAAGVPDERADDAAAYVEIAERRRDAGERQPGDFADDPGQIVGYYEECLTPERLQEVTG